MDKRIAGLLGAAAALTTVTTTQAAPAQPAAAAPTVSYADLLQPIPNAVATLKADDAERLQSGPIAKLERVQYHHHHHHHHHGFFPGAVIGGVIGGLLAASPPPAPCYWTYGRPYWDGYRWVHPRVQVCR
ncbi:MAG: hypothetical protein ACRECV_11745 [Xanthobacteraceae bacterium]